MDGMDRAIIFAMTWEIQGMGEEYIRCNFDVNHYLRVLEARKQTKIINHARS